MGRIGVAAGVVVVQLVDEAEELAEASQSVKTDFYWLLRGCGFAPCTPRQLGWV
jgi:hypothetical protein